MASALPTIISLAFVKTDGNHYIYLKLKSADLSEDDRTNELLQVSSNQISGPYAKFQVERATSKGAEGKGLIHMRSCFNNKYWCKADELSPYLGARGSKPQEDQSRWDCTLFRPVKLNDESFRFIHVGDGTPVQVRMVGAEDLYLGLATKGEIIKEDLQRFKIVDVSSLADLPEYVCFKGDNGKYLSDILNPGNGYVHVRFSGDDRTIPEAGFRISKTSDGNVQITSFKTGNLLQGELSDTNWLMYNPRSNVSPALALYTPIKVDSGEGNVIALRTGNGFFCVRDKNSNCLVANATTITKEARLTVQEYVLSSKITDVEYHVISARIYDKSLVNVTQDSVTNSGPTTTTMDVTIKHQKTVTSTWSTTLFAKFSAKLSFKVGIPLIASASGEFNFEASAEQKWGETTEKVTKSTVSHHVEVPPNSKVKVSLVASEASCEVPFSYTQTDTLMDGKVVSKVMHDGLYKGMNTFNYEFEVGKPVPI